MPYIREKKTKDGRRFYEIEISRGRAKKPITRRWYVPDGWSKKTIERELTKYAAELERQVADGTLISRDEQKERLAAEEAEHAKLKTFKQYAEGVYLPAKALEVSENTKTTYKKNLELHVFPILGDVLLTEVTPAMITKLLLGHMEKHAHSSTIKVYNIINGVFEMAFLDDSVPFNPMLKVKRPKQPKGEEETDGTAKALDADELARLFACLSKEPTKWQAFISLATDTGCRRGELCALEWSDIDFENCLITVRKNLQYTPGKGVYFTSPKNGKTREVDIGDDTISLLRRWKKEQSKICVCKYVFSPEKSNQYKHLSADKKKSHKEKKKTLPIEPMPMSPQSPTRYFHNFGEKYGFPGFHPHLLRHTSASVAITNGADVTSVSARLGHSDPAVTLRMYSHANKESIRRAGQVVRDAVKAAASEEKSVKKESLKNRDKNRDGAQKPGHKTI